MPCLAFFMAAGMSLALPDLLPMKTEGDILPAAMNCKSIVTCEDAVKLWCGGYERADRDKDGIPCENVFTSITRNGC